MKNMRLFFCLLWVALVSLLQKHVSWGCRGECQRDRMEEQEVHALMTNENLLRPSLFNSSAAPHGKGLSSFIKSFHGLLGHRLMSRLPSQFLLPAASLMPPFSKNGCLRESTSTNLLEGSYSSMPSIRSNNWWCSSASDRRYRWQDKRRKTKTRRYEWEKPETSSEQDTLLSLQYNVSFSVFSPIIIIIIPRHSSYP